MDVRRPRLLYLIPNFANPTGALLSLRRRRQVLALAAQYGVLIVEDDPYGELYFYEPPPPSLLSLARPEQREWIVHLSSFSKVLAPGLRLAWMTVPAELMKHVLLAKQINDTHTSAISQMVAFHFLNAGSLEPALSRARHFYAKQSIVMQRAINLELADFDIVTTPPKGGMFQWINLPNVDVHALLARSIEQGVAFVPGPHFFVDRSGFSALRLSFASANVDQIEEGIRRLARAIRQNR
jgi:DNA-binding transcriptional MocR family regulator